MGLLLPLLAYRTGGESSGHSRLGEKDLRQREIHKKLHTNLIIDHYDMQKLASFMEELGKEK